MAKGIKITLDPRTVQFETEKARNAKDFQKALAEAKALQDKALKVASADEAGKASGEAWRGFLNVMQAGQDNKLPGWLIAAELDQALGDAKKLTNNTIKMYRSVAVRLGSYWGTDMLKNAAQHANKGEPVKLGDRIAETGYTAAQKAVAQIDKDAKDKDMVTLSAVISFYGSLVRAAANEGVNTRAMLDHVSEQIHGLIVDNEQARNAYTKKFSGDSEASEKFIASPAGQFIIASRPVADGDDLDTALRAAVGGN